MRKMAANRPPARAQANDPNCIGTDQQETHTDTRRSPKIRADLVKYPGLPARASVLQPWM
jgi:hypothetical protein